ncbi:MAG: ABC transporter permease [Treponema sp.]|jgi:ribose transport system permease protein|nr:ABC transporter permease [Treponema sp.]
MILKFNSKATQTVLAFSSLILLIVIFSILSPNFRTYSNMKTILLMTAVNGILAVGITYIIITGGIDLSIGTVMTFCSVMCAVFITKLNFPVPAGLFAAVICGALCGLINGAFVAKLKLPPFIATLGMMNVTKGLNLIISGTKPVYLTDVKGFSNIALKEVLGIPSGVIIFFIAAIAAAFILSKTILGRYTFAIGSNEESARLSGINTDLWKMGIYSLSGIFFGIAGIVMASRLSSAQPAMGPGYEMDAIAAAVIGGASLSGGEGSILGTIIGAFIITVLTNGLRILSVPQEWQMVVTGIIVIGAVYMDIARRRIK